MKIIEPIYRKVTRDVKNSWGKITHREGEIVECIYDVGWAWIAKAIGMDDTPRRLPKGDCRVLTIEEFDTLYQIKGEDNERSSAHLC